jgi:hypothetical protein
MLTGAWPFGDPKSTADAVDRALHGREAGAPAQVVSEGAAAERSASRDRLRRQIEGDLSTILLKMLESEPAGRYGSVREVKEDLERFRQGRPVQARPHTAWYAARRFAARHWLAVSATGLSVVAAGEPDRCQSVYQSAQARAQAVRAQRVSEFAKNTFLSAGSYWYSPLRGKREAIQFSDILDNAAARVGQELGNDPAAEADLRSTLGLPMPCSVNRRKGKRNCFLGSNCSRGFAAALPKIAANLYANLCDARSLSGPLRRRAGRMPPGGGALSRGDHGVLGAVLHDSAFMAVNAGEPLPDAEADVPRSPAIPSSQPAHVSGNHDSRLGMLRLRQGDLEGASACCGTRNRRCAEKTNRSSRSFRFCTPARLGKMCAAAMRRPSG